MKITYKTIIWYTVIFGVLAAGVFLLFILSHKSFIQYGDGYRQGYFWLVENKHSLEALFSGDGISRWSWSKGLGLDTQFITDPFTVLAACFKAGYLELGYTVALVLELYFCGLAFLAFAKEVKMTQLQGILGAICYAFCGWGIDVALVQSSFVLKMILFPILILSVDRIYKGKSPFLFIITVAYYAVSGVYFAYMAAIGVIIYLLFRYAYYHDSFEIKGYLSTIGKFVIYGIIGLVISAAVSISYILMLLRASTDSVSDGYGLFYGLNYYLEFGKYLVSQVVEEGFQANYSYIGIPALVLMAVPVSFRKFSIKSTPAIMTIICGIMIIFPFFGSALNGFGYCSTRWFFMAAFFILWTGIEAYNLEKLSEKKNILIMLISLMILSVWTIVFDQLGIISSSARENLFILLQLFAGFMTLLLIFVFVRHRAMPWIEIFIVGLCMVTIVASWNVAFRGNIDNFLRNNEINSQLEKSTQRVANRIDDDGFYRVDQVNGIRNNRLLSKPANENLWWQSKSLYIYDSKIPSDMLELNGLVGNNYGYTERVYMLSNDNRMGLDLLMGVKYFLGNDTKAMHETPDNFVGYGFSKADTIDGVTIWKNKYDSGLGFGYNKYILKSQFEKLGRLEREQALLQAVVIDDKQADKIKTVQRISADEVVTDIKKVDYDIISTDGIKISDDRIFAAKDEASFTIRPKEAYEGQVILSLNGFDKLQGEETKDGNFKLYITDGKIEKSNVKEYNNQTLKGVEHYDINLGYHKGYDKPITLTLSEAGDYIYKNLLLSSMSAQNYDKFAAQRINNKFNISSYNDNNVTGNVDMKEDGIVFFSIYDYDNWDVYVDGKKAEKISNANIAFMGVEVSAGQHEIELKYNFGILKIGLAVSIIGIIMSIIVCLFHRKNRKRIIK